MTIEKNVLDYIGDVRQIGGLKRYTLMDGKAKGVEAIDVDNGSGLTFTVLADRCLDIDSLKFNGKQLAFLSRTGVVAPTFFNDREFEWLRSFGGGFLTTCGLSQVGEPCVYEGEPKGIHGLIANTPAESYYVSQKWVDDSYKMQIKGLVRQAKQQGENLVLERTISCTMGENTLSIEDAVTNEGTQPEPFMILYHFNFGYPLINPDCEVVIPAKTTGGLDEGSSLCTDTYIKMPPPTVEAGSNVFMHKLFESEKNRGEAMITDNKDNPAFALCIKFPTDVLHTLAQWRLPRTKEYVMALEPCNNNLRGITYEKEHGCQQFIQPGETVSIPISFTFLDDEESITKKKEQLLKLKG